MKSIYDTQVRDFLYNYESVLRKKHSYTNKYTRSKDRRKEKVTNFRKFLQNIGDRISSLPVCDKKKLGQYFGPDGKVLDSGLKMTTYSDESGFIWSISLFQVSKNQVKIYRVLPSSSVDEKLSVNSDFCEQLLEAYDLYWHNLFR